MYISGWGNNLVINSNIIYPKNINEIIRIIKNYKSKGVLVRGMGRSYGDVALSENIISLKNYEKTLELDETNGYLKCSSNITISEINELTISKGWFLNITPGSKFVSVGGAIANDVHGKNHHKVGSFKKHIIQFKLINRDKKIIICSKTKNNKLFNFTVGGMGLTGIIYSCKFKLKKIPK